MVQVRTLLVLLLFPLVGCGVPFYTAAPIEAQVVDAETGQPIQGAVIVANWQLVRGGLDGPHDAGQLEVKEATTDKTGRFHLEGFTKSNGGFAELRDDDPRILIFKFGYEAKTFSNNYPKAGTQTPGAFRTSSINGQVVRLRRYAPVRMGGSDVFYPFIRIDLEIVMRDCGWKKTPLVLLAMDKAQKEIGAAYPQATTGLVNLENIEVSDRAECGSVVEFLKGHSK